MQINCKIQKFLISIMRILVFILTITLLTKPLLSFSLETELMGKWQCGPYNIVTSLSNITSTDTYIFLKNNAYSEVTDTTYKYFKNEITLNLMYQIEGTWNTEENLLIISPETAIAEITSPSIPESTKEIMQREAETELKKVKYSKYIIDSLTENEMLLRLIDAKNKDLENFLYKCKKDTDK